MTLTATATAEIRKTVINDLGMLDCSFIIENTDRPNIRYSVLNIPNDVLSSFQWLIDDLLEKGPETAQTLIFCQSKVQCYNLYEYFKQQLGESMFTGEPHDDRTSLIGMYHHGTRAEQKLTAENAFTSESSIMRILFCTSSFGMGINVKNCNLVIHLGPPKLLDEYLQQSGRVGRDGKQSYALLLIYKKCTSGPGFDSAIRSYVTNEKVCRRKMLMDAIENPCSSDREIKHTCCDICKGECKCLCLCELGKSDNVCTCDPVCVGPEIVKSKAENKIFQCTQQTVGGVEKLRKVRSVTMNDRELFRKELDIIRQNLIGEDVLLPKDVVSGFSTELVSSLVNSLEYLSSVDVQYTRTSGRRCRRRQIQMSEHSPQVLGYLTKVDNLLTD